MLTRITAHIGLVRAAVLIGAAFFALAAPVAAEPWQIDFDSDTDGSSFAGNTIFGNGNGGAFQRYTDGIPEASVGVTISAESHYNARGEIDLAVGFDSERSRTRDRDLEDPFTPTGNGPNGTPVASGGYGNILIVQSSEDRKTRSCANAADICKKADDEGAGGILRFDFSEAVLLLGMNVFDTEEGGGSVRFLDAIGDEVVALTPLPDVGDRGVGFMGFGEGVVAHSMHVTFNGSGAIDNILGNRTPGVEGTNTAAIPEPSAFALFGFGLAALGFWRRRKPAV